VEGAGPFDHGDGTGLLLSTRLLRKPDRVDRHHRLLAEPQPRQIVPVSDQQLIIVRGSGWKIIPVVSTGEAQAGPSRITWLRTIDPLGSILGSPPDMRPGRC
jgi:hypothetical protein